MRRIASAHFRNIAVGLAILAILALYLLTLDDGLRPDELMGGDLITHQYAQAQARFANAPGYPLYTMLGWLWFHIGRHLLGWAFNPVQVLSLYSTLWAIAALIVFYLLLLEVAPGRWLVALWGAAYYAITYFFWYYAVTTEQYTSAVFQTLLLIWLALKWERDRNPSLLLWMAFVTGTCAANLVTTLFVVPPLVAFILWEEPSLLRKPALVFKMACLAFLPLLSYIYVYVRGAQHPEWRGLGNWPSTLAWFLEFLTAPQGRSEMSWTLWPPGGNYPWLAFWELSWPVFLAGLVGWAFLGKKRALLFYGTAAIYFAFCYIDRFGNWYQVIMPLYPLVILGAVVLVDHLLTRYPKRAFQTLLGASLLVLLVWRFASNYHKADQSGRLDATGLEPGWAILADAPPEGSCIAGTYGENLALQYLGTIWGARPSIRIVTVEEAIDLSLRGESCYITSEVVNAAPNLWELGLHPSSAGARLIRLNPAPVWELPAQVCLGKCVPVHRLRASFEGKMRLAGYAAIREKGALRVSLFWQAMEPLKRDYVVSVRPTLKGQLLPREGGFIQQDHQPVWGAYPTSRWVPGEIVRDDYRLDLGVSPGKSPEKGEPPSPQVDGIQIVIYFVENGKVVNVGKALDIKIN